jgi:hypothetical protein
MCGDVKEMEMRMRMREGGYGRRGGDFGVSREPAWRMRRGDSSTEAIKTVEGKGADKAEREGVDHNAS